jgi:hypothetical protein
VSPRLRIPSLAVAAVAAALACVPAAAAAPASDATRGPSTAPVRGTANPPKGFRMTAGEAKALARKVPKVRDVVGHHRRVHADASTKGPGVWQVDFYARGKDIAQVRIDDLHRRVTEAWTGYQVAWTMARGYSGAFGRKINAPYVWLPLCALFLVGLVDWRRPFRLVHLDLLVLLGFGASHFFFNRGDIGVSVPLAYPPLLYLMVRALWIGFRGGGAGLRPVVPVAWLAVAVLFLAGFRIGLNVADANVIDVGYSGVIGADRLAHGEDVYGNFPGDDQAGDTYGPAAYYPYVPFELAFPWHGKWDDLPAAHGAAIFFDLLAMGGLFLLGRGLRPGRLGRDLGVMLAFAWASFPYTAFVLESGSNDALVAALVIAAFVVIARPLARGAIAALAALTKFAPLVLVPLLAGYRGEGDRRLRPLALFCAGFAAAAAIVMLETLLGPGLKTFWDRTIAFQAGRDSPFSVWGQAGGIESLQTALKAAIALLAMAVAFVPRRKSIVQALALGAAVLIGVELTLEHWFYLYMVWISPRLIAAIAAGGGETQPSGAGISTWSIDSARPSSRIPTEAPITQTSSSAVSKRTGSWVRKASSA